MGEDGNEYGPVSVGEVRQWIAEGRLEKKSPVKPPGGADWVFLGDVPEFADFFKSRPVRPPAPPVNKGLLAIAVLVVLAVAAYFLYQHFNHR